LLGHVLERPRRRCYLGQGRVGALNAEARQPPQRGALVAVRLGFTDRDTDRQRITQIDLRQFRCG
jgi:hypothetical protein